VHIYEATDWLTNVLNYNNNSEPVSQPFQVQNQSWVSLNTVPTSQDQSILRRYDWTIENEDLTAVVGANNAGAIIAHPALLAHSYNAIVVGRSDSGHSRGVTHAAYGGGRYRPDVVAPATLTSHATPIVGSVASLLRSAVAGTDGDRSEPIKAMIMAGATKTEFNGFLDPFAGSAPRPWDRTPTRPLDDIFGAGEVNVYNSYLMTVGGQVAGSTTQPSASVGSYGWDYQNRKSDSAVGDLYYNFEVPTGSTAQELSIILAWNAKITDTHASPGNFAPSESLQNLDLQFYNSTDSFLGALVDQSISTVDNVEHIYQTNLGPGTYTLKVSGAANWDYGLAWRMTTAFDQISADFDEDGDVDGSDMITWQQNLGTLLGATHAEGDADGDGDVDTADLAAVNAGVMPLPQIQSRGQVQVLAAAIPEPSTLAIAAAAMFAAGWASGRVRHG
jgi:hypothetical protein